MQHLIFILFLFALGACVGSFLNVVIWRLPRDESLVSPPSRCPYCEHRLAWFDNVPVVGWLALRGRCRYCYNPISPQYPAIEFITGALFVLYYVMFFIAHEGPCWTDIRVLPGIGPIVTHLRLTTLAEHWPQYLLAVITISCLLAASLIDARHFIIPLSIPILMAIAGVLYHLLFDRPRVPGSLTVHNPAAGALAVGAGLGVLASNLLLWRKMLPRSFSEGWPALEIEKEPQVEREPGWLSRLVGGWIQSFRRKLTPQEQRIMQEHRAAAEHREQLLHEQWMKQVGASQPPIREFSRADIRREMRSEIIFLLPPLLGGLLAVMALVLIHPLGQAWQRLSMGNHVLSGFVGSLLGALVGGFVVWITRILGSLVFGREAMGMGDVHLMFGVGAIIGAGAATVAFFLAPFFGILIALYMLLTGKRRELPYGPYLSLATAFVMIWYCDIADYLRPGMQGLGAILRSWFGMAR